MKMNTSDRNEGCAKASRGGGGGASLSQSLQGLTSLSSWHHDQAGVLPIWAVSVYLGASYWMHFFKKTTPTFCCRRSWLQPLMGSAAFSPLKHFLAHCSKAENATRQAALPIGPPECKTATKRVRVARQNSRNTGPALSTYWLTGSRG